MSEPKSTTTPKKHPFTPGDKSTSPVALDEVHKQQLKSLKKMSKNDLIIALEARNMDTTGTKPILHARLRSAYLEEAWEPTEPPAEETKVPAIAEDADDESEADGSAIAGDDGDASSDAVSATHQRSTDGSSSGKG